MRKNKFLVIAGVLMLSFSCTKTLDQAPKGALSTETLTNKDGAEALVISAYALLDQVFSDSWSPIAAIFNPASNWSYSDVRCGDAYTGGGGTGDIGELNSLELGIVEPTNSLINNKWRVLFYGVSRCNKALQLFPCVPIRPKRMRSSGYSLHLLRVL